MSNESAGASSSLTSVSNGLKVLSMLQANPSLRVVDVSRSLDIAGSTAHRLLTCLRIEGFLRQPASSRRYVAGPELLRLARHFSDQNTLERSARPHLEALCTSLNEAVNLQTLVGTEVLCIDSVVQDRHSLQVRSITGQRAPARVSAAGKLLLSALQSAELEELLARIDVDPAEVAALHLDLETIRKRGYATNMGEREPGVHAVAVPVLDRTGHAIAAVAVAAPSIRLPAVRVAGLVQDLQAASAAITEEYYGVSP
jgi:DNA-binding IclR family transcriptional regulator